MEKQKCDECGSTSDVHESLFYYAHGRNCFDFQWSTCKIVLCEDCEQEHLYCHSCGALVDRDHYGICYSPDLQDLPDEYDGDAICPECYRKMQGQICH